jgi:hypothetical protein
MIVQPAPDEQRGLNFQRVRSWGQSRETLLGNITIDSIQNCVMSDDVEGASSIKSSHGLQA